MTKKQALKIVTMMNDWNGADTPGGAGYSESDLIGARRALYVSACKVLNEHARLECERLQTREA